MSSKIVSLSPEGVLTLPEELREKLKDTQSLLITWDENLIILKPQNGELTETVNQSPTDSLLPLLGTIQAEQTNIGENHDFYLSQGYKEELNLEE